MTTKTFHLGDILSITTSRLVSPRHIDGVYDILNWMTGDNLFTHQLPRASEECEGPLLAQHPDLANVVVPDSFGETADEAKAAVDRWLAEQIAVYGETREVAPLAAVDHTAIDPLTEMQSMIRPDTEIIAVVAPDEPES
jgi:hypothetical protein